ncbi:MAG: hypothetical protein MZV64_21615, partial [Ignavibacteriales bacterium]|nr:hypothetical protein [Ignavibacteriales bacterium]
MNQRQTADRRKRRGRGGRTASPPAPRTSRRYCGGNASHEADHPCRFSPCRSPFPNRDGLCALRPAIRVTWTTVTPRSHLGPGSGANRLGANSLRPGRFAMARVWHDSLIMIRSMDWSAASRPHCQARLAVGYSLEVPYNPEGQSRNDLRDAARPSRTKLVSATAAGPSCRTRRDSRRDGV